MIITVSRQFQTKRTTVSTVFIDGKFQCFGLENPHHDVKIPGNTRIPSGKYPVELRTVGGKHKRYLKHFPNSHQGMLWVQDVPGFEHILIHIGNQHSDTDGCLLLGESVNRRNSKNYTIGSSRLAYLSFYDKVFVAAWNSDLHINIKDDS